MKNFDLEELKNQILSFGRNAEQLDISINDYGLTVKLKDYPVICTTFTTDEAEDMTPAHKIDIGYLLSWAIIAFDAGKATEAKANLTKQKINHYFGEDAK